MTTPAESAEIAAWLNTHQPTRCPTVAIAETTAVVPKETTDLLLSRTDILWNNRPLNCADRRVSAQNAKLVKSAYGSHRKPMEDLSGKRYNMMTVLKFVGIAGGKYLWRCLCDCGAETEVRRTDLIAGKTKSCGCTRKPSMEGRRFGSYVVVAPGKRPVGNVDRERYWQCKCDCGGEKLIRSSYLRMNSGACRCKRTKKAK